MKGLDKRLILMLKQGSPLPEYLLQSFLEESYGIEAARPVHYTMCLFQPRLTLLPNCLIRVFASSKMLLEANLVFCQISQPSVHSWQAIISAYHTCGEYVWALHLYHRMVLGGILPNRFIFSCVLRACAISGEWKEGMHIHEHVIRSGLDSDVVVGSTILDMYAKCSNVQDARRVFDRLSSRNVVTWNALISGYVLNGLGHNALKLLKEVPEPNKVTYICSLKACTQTEDLMQGKRLHQQVIYKGLECDVIIGNTLIDMYAKCGEVDGACAILHSLLNRNVVSWSALITAASAHPTTFSCIYQQMQHECVTPDRVAMVAFLNVCRHTRAIKQGELIHRQIIKRGFDTDLVVRGALIDMYMKCDRLDDAQDVFDEVSSPTIVLWGEMISGYSKHGKDHHALELYSKMQHAGIAPDMFLFSCLLKACGRIGALEQGKMLQAEMMRNQVKPDVAIGNAMISMYMRCGDLTEACRIFNELPYRDSTSWGFMISIHAQYGDGKLAIQCFNDMQKHGIKPNEMVFTRLLSSCSRTGEGREGKFQLNAMNERQYLGPSNKHFTCMLELLGSIGDHEAAKNVLQTMPFTPNIINWMSVLTACKRHGNTELGQHCIQQINQLGSHLSLENVLLPNMYTKSCPSDTMLRNYSDAVLQMRTAVDCG